MSLEIPTPQIQREAAAAAHVYDDINAACPYPFNSQAGSQFKKYFELEKQRIAARAWLLVLRPLP